MLQGYLNQDGVKEIGGVQFASYTATAADATANAMTITLDDLPSVEIFLVRVLRAGVDVTADAVVTASGKVLTVADGGVTYNVTAGDIVHIAAAGKVTE